MAGWVVAFSLVLARVATFVGVLPLFGGRDVPRTVKAVLALTLTCSWFDFAALPARELFAPSVDVSWLGYGAALLREALLGAMLGYALGLFLAPLKVAGEFITQQMGLSLGAIVDPTSNSSSGALTQILEMLGTLLFFGLNCHHLFLAVLHSTLTHIPVGAPFGMNSVERFIAGGAATEEWGLVLIAPVAACLFLTHVVLALMTRAAPQMNIFSVGFALQIGIGLAAIFFLMPDLLSAIVQMFGRVGELLTRLV
jgi:flagellar biosynthetic protein FliR